VIAGFTIFGIGFAILHAIYHFTIVFQLLFGGLAWMCLFRVASYYHSSTDPRARAVCKTSMYAALGGFALWMLDYNYCGQINRLLPFNPQCHAWWHLLMGVCTYNSPLFMQFVRAEELQKKPELVDTPLIGLQTIVVHANDCNKLKTL
jgi:dihydroceramidase